MEKKGERWDVSSPQNKKHQPFKGYRNIPDISGTMPKRNTTEISDSVLKKEGAPPNKYNLFLSFVKLSVRGKRVATGFR